MPFWNFGQTSKERSFIDLFSWAVGVRSSRSHFYLGLVMLFGIQWTLPFLDFIFRTTKKYAWFTQALSVSHNLPEILGSLCQSQILEWVIDCFDVVGIQSSLQSQTQTWLWSILLHCQSSGTNHYWWISIFCGPVQIQFKSYFLSFLIVLLTLVVGIIGYFASVFFYKRRTYEKYDEYVINNE